MAVQAEFDPAKHPRDSGGQWASKGGGGGDRTPRTHAKPPASRMDPKTGLIQDPDTGVWRRSRDMAARLLGRPEPGRPKIIGGEPKAFTHRAPATQPPPPKIIGGEPKVFTHRPETQPKHPPKIIRNRVFTNRPQEANAPTNAAALLRKGVKPTPTPSHDAIATDATADDIARKRRLRSVMGTRTSEAGVISRPVVATLPVNAGPVVDASHALDPDHLAPDEQYDQTEVNYRYSGDATKACAVCVHFMAPDGCEIVSGLIRSVDVCDLFQAVTDRRPGASNVFPDASGLDELYEAGVLDDPNADGYDDRGGNCPDAEKDMQGRCPGEPDYDDTTVGLHRDPRRAELIEKAPPGFEPVVKALKRRPIVDNPYAVAWAMRNRGARPRAESDDERGFRRAEILGDTIRRHDVELDEMDAPSTPMPTSGGMAAPSTMSSPPLTPTPTSSSAVV